MIWDWTFGLFVIQIMQLVNYPCLHWYKFVYNNHTSLVEKGKSCRRARWNAQESRVTCEKIQWSNCCKASGGTCCSQIRCTSLTNWLFQKSLINEWSKNPSNFIEKMAWFTNYDIKCNIVSIILHKILAMTRNFQFFRFWVVDQIC